MPLSVAELARICGGTAEGNTERLITGANTLEAAAESDLAFAANKRAMETATKSQAGCLLVPQEFESAGNRCIIRVSDPRAAFARALAALYPRKSFTGFIHPAAVVAK